MVVEQIRLATLILGLIIGSLFLLLPLYVYLKHQKLPPTVLVLASIGTLLFGLSIWQSVDISVDSNGAFTASYKLDRAKEEIGNADKLLHLSDDISKLENLPPIYLTMDDVRHYMDVCDAYEVADSPDFYTTEELKEKYPGLTRDDACNWTMIGFTTSNWQTIREILLKLKWTLE